MRWGVSELWVVLVVGILTFYLNLDMTNRGGTFSTSKGWIPSAVVGRRAATLPPCAHFSKQCEKKRSSSLRKGRWDGIKAL